MTLKGIAKAGTDQIGNGEGGGCPWSEEDPTCAGLYYQRVEGWFDYDNLYREIVDSASEGAHFVEIGAFHGRSTCFLAEMIKQSGKQISLDVVDTFTGNSSEAPPGGGYYETFLNHIISAGLQRFVNIKQLTSVAASRLYQDASLDFVFIDADHSYECVSEDILHWKKKVKPGGYIGGHDYDVTLLGVVKAVDENFPEHYFYPPRCWIVPFDIISPKALLSEFMTSEFISLAFTSSTGSIVYGEIRHLLDLDTDISGEKALQVLRCLPRDLVIQAYRPVPKPYLVDCLDQVKMTASECLNRYSRSIAILAGPGSESVLSDFLTSLSQYGECPDVAIIAFVVDGHKACSKVLRKHGLPVIPCHPIQSSNSTLRGILYSVARSMVADKYLCFDLSSQAPLRITGSLQPIFDGLDELPASSILLSQTSFLPGLIPKTLADQVCQDYGGVRGDVDFLTGDLSPIFSSSQTDSSIFAGSRSALLDLDRTLRLLQPFASVWINGGSSDQGDRSEFIFNLAIRLLQTNLAFSFLPLPNGCLQRL